MSSSIDLRAVLAKSLESLSAQLNEAVVYLDDEAAACLSASVGLSTLLSKSNLVGCMIRRSAMYRTWCGEYS